MKITATIVALIGTVTALHVNSSRGLPRYDPERECWRGYQCCDNAAGCCEEEGPCRKTV